MWVFSQLHYVINSVLCDILVKKDLLWINKNDCRYTAALHFARFYFTRINATPTGTSWNSKHKQIVMLVSEKHRFFLLYHQSFCKLQCGFDLNKCCTCNALCVYIYIHLQWEIEIHCFRSLKYTRMPHCIGSHKLQTTSD